MSHQGDACSEGPCKDEEILVLPADKGKATVVMNKADYDHKMQQMLCDEDTYQPLKKDPTTSLENKMNARLLQLKKCGRLPPDVYSRLRSSAGRVPMFYGLPKVHKPDVPLRPIVSFMSSPTYELSKFLARLLAPLVGSSYHASGTYVMVLLLRACGLKTHTSKKVV